MSLPPLTPSQSMRRVIDTTIGGNELERKAEANLRAALEGWR